MKYSDLKVWQKGVELSKAVYALTQTFPANQQYGLKSQIERSVVSIPSNIAEGSGRNGTKEFIYHLGVAQGALYEVETQFIACEVGFLGRDGLDGMLQNTKEIGRMINGLINKLEGK